MNEQTDGTVNGWSGGWEDRLAARVGEEDGWLVRCLPGGRSREMYKGKELPTFLVSNRI